ncbi:MAG: YdiU family protein [Rhodobacteraceae bacterium]|nr:YdiU family protein [Paracoccaceae bacterium]
MPLTFQNTYARLPDQFFSHQPAADIPAPVMLKMNRALADRLGIGAATLDNADGAAFLSGAAFPEGAEPVAMAYAGHQFGNFVPQLGDGRALLLGEVLAPDGMRFDIHLKGSGRTQFSRGGDGKAVLGPVLREYLIGEAMAALGVPTTRALAAVLTGETVWREEPEPGAVLARVAASHIRVGTFQFFYVRQDFEALRRLLDYAIERHYPQAASADVPALAFLGAVMARQAALVARWMGVGFIHGVMNTDNMAISGETIDYGPCAFMDTYDPGTVYSSIDQMGRYAYANQPRIAHWNLAQLAQSLLPLVPGEPEAAANALQGVVDGFPALYDGEWLAVFGRKIGLVAPTPGDQAMIEDLLALMADAKADFTLAFRHLTRALATDKWQDIEATFAAAPVFADWRHRWLARLGADRALAVKAMVAANPAFIPRNHRVEAALQAARNCDMSIFEELLAILSRPYAEQPENAAFEAPPGPGEAVQATFCGT